MNAFHQAHRAHYGYAQEQNSVEIVSARVRSIGLVEGFKEDSRVVARRLVKPHGNVMAYILGRRAQVGVYQREELRPGAKLVTPCIVTESSATTLVSTDMKAHLDQFFGNLLMQFK